ncbi:MAG: V4R domain-containing protein [Promethearchaeota archaeon]
MLLEVFIIIGEGMLLLRRSFTKKMEVNGDLFSALITAIVSFVSEIQMGDVRKFETGNKQILIYPHEKIVIVGIVDEKHEDEHIYKSLKMIGEEFSKKYEKTLSNWTGELDPFCEFTRTLDEIVYSNFAEEYISKDFPNNVIRSVKKFQTKFQNEIMYFMGSKAGRKRASLLKNPKNFKKRLQKELNLFSINKIKEESENELLIEVPLCPFCRKIKNKEFSCDFFMGFIAGFASKSLGKKNIQVKEIHCSAHGDETCTFLLKTN